MSGIMDLAIAAGSGSGGTFLLQSVRDWIKGRGDTSRANRQIDAKLEQHKGDLTLKLLDAAQESVVHLQKQVSDLLPLMPTAAHLAESLDHIHALLHAHGDAEIKAAERRARAFLRRMRPEIGDLRNAAQATESARRVIGDVEGQP
jgi:hypothetical protein